MRRSEREILDDEKIDEIINKCKVLRVAFKDKNEIYIIPVNFGMEYNAQGNRVFYIHGANEGRKINLLKQYPNVGFELDCECRISKTGEEDCSYTAYYQSVVGTGIAGLLNVEQEKKRALDCIMQHYTGRNSFNYDESLFKKTAIWALEVEKISCKAHK